MSSSVSSRSSSSRSPQRQQWARCQQQWGKIEFCFINIYWFILLHMRLYIGLRSALGEP
jgi:hypothetical protein